MKFKELGVRFAFGFGIAAVAAVVGAIWGNKIGGILLGFPAILPASLTLIERHEGKQKAAIDATGAILGSVALIVFAITATWTLPRFPSAPALATACAAWLLTGLGLYALAVRLPMRRKRLAKRAKHRTA
ncbi:MAG TPA: DUF3147 family protein [Candidatus Dormibacteraeota bacterium]